MNLNYTIDRYGGAFLETPQTTSNELFASQIGHTLQELEGQGCKLAWLFLPIGLSSLVPTATEMGFIYHHAHEQGLQLYRKLIPDAFVPAYASHFIGAGGVVIDEEDRILTIQERYHTKKHYKLPGGALEPNEHISDAAVREVFEETGIRTEFLSLNCFRHWHEYRFGKSDIYLICRLKPLSHTITIDPNEISEAIWMPIEEFMHHPDTHPFNRKIVEVTLSTRGLQREEIPDYGTSETHEMMFSRG